MEEDNLGAFDEQIDWENEFGEIEDKEFESDYDVDIDVDFDDDNENENNKEKGKEGAVEEPSNEEEATTTDEIKEEEEEEKKEEEKKDDDDDDEGWITPDNINKFHAKHYGWNTKKESKTYDVACMTADFAMQVCIISI